MTEKEVNSMLVEILRNKEKNQANLPPMHIASAIAGETSGIDCIENGRHEKICRSWDWLLPKEMQKSIQEESATFEAPSNIRYKAIIG